MNLISVTNRGLYCARGDFYIDPWSPVDRALITHAHSDHARAGSAHYFTAEANSALLRNGWGRTLRSMPCAMARAYG